MTPHYCKLADSVVDAGLGPYAGWLYTVIIRHINRKCNQLCKTVKELAVLAGMSARSVIRYTKLLEAKKLLHVQRSQTSEIADKNVYSLLGEAAQIALFNGVPDSHSASDSQSQQSAEGHVPQSHRKESDSNDSLNVRERDFIPEGIDQRKFFEDDPMPNPEDVPQYLRQQVPSAVIRQQLADYSAKLGVERYAEVLARCTNAHSWEYVIKALANEVPPTPSSAPPPSSGDTTEKDIDVDDTPDIDFDEWMKELQAKPEPKPLCAPTISPDAAKWWESAYSQLSIQLDRSSFETYTRCVQLVSVDGNRWTFTAANPYAADMLNHRLNRELCRVLSDVTGVDRKQLVMRFEAEVVQHG